MALGLVPSGCINHVQERLIPTLTTLLFCEPVVCAIGWTRTTTTKLQVFARNTLLTAVNTIPPFFSASASFATIAFNLKNHINNNGTGL